MSLTTDFIVTQDDLEGEWLFPGERLRICLVLEFVKRRQELGAMGRDAFTQNLKRLMDEPETWMPSKLDCVDVAGHLDALVVDFEMGLLQKLQKQLVEELVQPRVSRWLGEITAGIAPDAEIQRRLRAAQLICWYWRGCFERSFARMQENEKEVDGIGSPACLYIFGGCISAVQSCSQEHWREAEPEFSEV